MTTVSPRYAWEAPEQRNGFVFHHVDHPALESAMARAIRLWREDPDQFSQLMLNGMRADRSWAQPGRDYLNVYDYVRHKDAPARQPELDSIAAPPHDRSAADRMRARELVHAIAARTRAEPRCPQRIAADFLSDDPGTCVGEAEERFARATPIRPLKLGQCDGAVDHPLSPADGEPDTEAAGPSRRRGGGEAQ